MKRRCFTLVWLSLLALIALPSHAQTGSLTVFAAASLTDAFEEIGAAFEQANPGVDVAFSFGSSSTLATQIIEGAPADVFASANPRQMSVAADAGRIGGSPRTFARNRLVLIVPADNPAAITSILDLATPGVKLVVAAPAVPVRDYTDAMLDRLAADPNYGEAFRGAVVSNIVSEEDNVRQVAAKVALGEADAGVVYHSDITPDIADQVIAIPIPDSLNTMATYPIATTHDTANPELAQAFADFVLSDAGQDILVRWNFISVRIPPLPDTITLSFGGSIAVEGQVLNPLTLTADDLRANYAAQTVDATYLSGDEMVTATFTGVLLWDILSTAQPNFNADVHNDKLSTYIVVTGSDGDQAVIAWGEIDPDYAGKAVLLAYEQDGAPLQDEQSPVRLVVPGDVHGGRYVSSVVDISLRDAPPVSG